MVAILHALDGSAEAFTVEAPVHPGWNGTTTVADDTITALAARYLEALVSARHHEVALVGSSVGGWIAAEMAVLDARREAADRVLGSVVLIDTVGFDVPGEPIRDVFALDARGVAEYSWADPERGYLDPATRTPEELATMRGNLASLRDYAGDPYMHDPSLLERIGALAIPTLVLWGDADRIVTPAYGRTVATAIPGAEFLVIEGAGHLPHLERPGATAAVIDAFLAGV